jgi:ABC-type Fe3+-hydroxamate transport system substrate-binding protein
LKGLAPDLVIANKEENTREDIEKIREFCPVWTSDVPNVSSALAMISDLASLLKVEDEGRRLKEEIMAGFARIVPAQKKAAYLIWKKPYMAAGGDTFISSMMEAAGYANVFTVSRRYPEVTIEDLQALRPDLIMLSSEPYPFKMKDIEELSQYLPDISIQLVDGEMFSWYGSRMKYFAAETARIADALRPTND